MIQQIQQEKASLPRTWKNYFKMKMQKPFSTPGHPSTINNKPVASLCKNDNIKNLIYDQNP